MASLDCGAAELAALQQLLSPQEHERAKRFRFERDRQWFVAGRGQLRVILGRYLNMCPADLRISSGPYGKPELHSDGGQAGLQFNLSHSAGRALYAVSCGRSVGVDLEYIRPLPDAASIARKFFSRDECRALEALVEEQRLSGFYTCWTRKEAYVKARGDGLLIPLDSFTVSCTPGKPAALITAADSGEVHRWQLHELQVGDGCVAALAVAQPPVTLTHWTYPAQHG